MKVKPPMQRLNSLSREEATTEFFKCCGSRNWANGMADARPFHDWASLIETAENLWQKLSEQDWLEAFSAHPKIGEKKAAQPGPTGTEQWSEDEQSGTRYASSEIMSELAEANRAYETKFDHIFIVCATGKSSEEMLALLKQRLGNDPATELRIAAEEQRRITLLRLEKSLEA